MEQDFVMNALATGNYELLPDAIAIGPVYKIKYSGSLNEDGIERGFLYLPKGSGIRVHRHIFDIEIYRLVKGYLSIESKPMEINICGLNNAHCIDPVPVDTIIATCKMNELFLGMPIDAYVKKYEYLKSRN